MVQSRGLKSIFSHDLDRAVFVTYFLGAVIPLLALGWVTHRYALPLIRNDTRTTAELVALVAAVACLSLVSFFALRRRFRIFCACLFRSAYSGLFSLYRFQYPGFRSLQLFCARA